MQKRNINKTYAAMNKLAKVKEKLGKLPIDQIARETGFHQRNRGKINGLSFVMSFFEMVLQDHNTLNAWALHFAKLTGKRVSPQAIHERLQSPQAAEFAKQLLVESLVRIILEAKSPEEVPKLFKHFTEVLNGDSTCVKVPPNNKKSFPGSGGWGESSAVIRIQLVINILNNVNIDICVMGYRENDQSYALAITERLKGGELVIRDLGYWSLEAFKAIAEKGAFFLSRLKFGVHLLDPTTHQPIDLDKKLQKALRTGQQVVEMNVLAGKKVQQPMRLIATLVPQQIYRQRLHNLKNNRDKRLKPSKAYKQRLRWNIFVTNVPAKMWTWQDVERAYGYRWRVETIFKCWKSKLNLAQLFADKRSLNSSRVLTTLYLHLMWTTYFFTSFYNYYLYEAYRLKRRFVSILKFADFLATFFEKLIQCDDLSQFIDIVCNNCLYDRRKDRENYMESLCLEIANSP